MVKKLCLFITVSFALISSMNYSAPLAIASTARDVVISEIAWAGSGDSASDEWLELYNNTNTAIDLTGWSIEDDDGAQTYELTGSVPAHSYFLLESREIATSVSADQVRSLSLSNAGDSLILKDIIGNTIDTVNSASGTWPAGNNTSHATMERVSLTSDGNSASNWQTSSSNSNATASNGTNIVGSPKSGSTVSTPPQGGTIVKLNTSKTTIHQDEEFEITVAVENASNISNWGIDITYDAQKLKYIRSNEGNFLNENGATASSFQGGLQNDQEGRVVLAGARTVSPLTGRSGNGELFKATFAALNTVPAGTTVLQLANESFLSTPAAHIDLVNWPSSTITLTRTDIVVAPVSNLQIEPGVDRYSLNLSWNPSSTTGASYKVYRQDSDEQYVLLGSTGNNSFLDTDTVTLGGDIIPQQAYHYKVVAVVDNLASEAALIQGVESRGLKGDNNRSDRVDGSDLEAVARLWTIDSAQSSFSPLVDTSYDGIISGSDLIDLAVSWAKTYS